MARAIERWIVFQNYLTKIEIIFDLTKRLKMAGKSKEVSKLFLSQGGGGVRDCGSDSM